MNTDEKVLVYCLNEPVSAGNKSIQYAPPGKHHIFPRVHSDKYDGNGVTIEINADTAEMLDKQLQEWLIKAERGIVSRPFIDFDHEGKAAAAIPKKFYWENGLRLELEWTQSGKDGIEGRNYSYFSPELMFNLEDGAITGLPYSGSIGSLVNTPAFQNIERLAAASTKPKQNPTIMDDKTQEKLVAAEAKLVNFEKEVATLKASLESVTKERDDAVKEWETTDAALKTEQEKIVTLEASLSEVRKGKIKAAIEAKGIKEENREAVLAACLTQEDDGAKLLAAYEAPRSGGIPPLDKNKKQDGQTEVKGLARVSAAFSAQSQK